MNYNILVINPGSTSDALAYYRGENTIFDITVRYTETDLKPFEGQNIISQKAFRKELILKTLKEYNVPLTEINAVIGRGGIMRPVQSGVYAVNDAMIEDLTNSTSARHPANLGAVLAREIASGANCPAFIADPVSVDELEPLARYSGMPEITRRPIFHALNQKRMARITADKMGRKYEEFNFIVLHAGGGVSVGAHKKGRVVDVTDGFGGEGPFTPNRSGALPSLILTHLCYSGKYNYDQMYLKQQGRGGIVGYTGTTDLSLLAKFIEDGAKAPAITCTREKAKEVIDAFCYKLAKDIGAMAMVLEGKVDGIIFTGGIAYYKYVTDIIRSKTAWIAPFFVYPGGDEKGALHDSAVRALENPSIIKQY